MTQLSVIDQDHSTDQLIRYLTDQAVFSAVRRFGSLDEFWSQSDCNAHVVFCDFIAGEGSCLDLLARASSDRVLLAVVAMMPSFSLALVCNALQAGVATVVLKPLKAKQVIEAAEQAITLISARYEEHLQRCDAYRRFESLSSIERELLHLLVSGLRRNEIAAVQDVAIRTIEARRKQLFEKLDVTSDVDLVRAATLLATRGEPELRYLDSWPALKPLEPAK